MSGLVSCETQPRQGRARQAQFNLFQLSTSLGKEKVEEEEETNFYDFL